MEKLTGIVPPTSPDKSVDDQDDVGLINRFVVDFASSATVEPTKGLAGTRPTGLRASSTSWVIAGNRYGTPCDDRLDEGFSFF